ncbi:MAG: (5-formylfuran-3-yl)methyl phosphate synthase [Gammaproteobacteria bacterium]|nr:(5-formylfuran-3-yl)methyl phosphate synthase [Gammaproteobacteria bacterium]
MTGFLASVRSAAEARQVLPAGVDILDVKEPDAGALGAVSDATLRDIVACARGVVPVSATVGDLPMAPEQLGPAIERTWSAGVDIVKVGVFADAVRQPVLSLLDECSARGVRIVLVYFAEQWRGEADFIALSQAGIGGVMLDTRDKQAGSLTSRVSGEELNEFALRARQAELMAGLAGSLREADIPQLLALNPDYLGFRGALCGGAGRGAAIEVSAVQRIARTIHDHGSTGTLLPARVRQADPALSMAV